MVDKIVSNDILVAMMERENRSVQVGVRLTKSEAAAFKRIASANGSTLAATVRLAMLEFLQKDENIKKLQ